MVAPNKQTVVKALRKEYDEEFILWPGSYYAHRISELLDQYASEHA